MPLKKKKFKMGLVLSGGGARGFAHLGAIKALNDLGIFPDVISGVSAGAIVGAFYADGYSPEEILNLFSQHDKKKRTRLYELIIPKTGLFKASGLIRILKEYLRAEKFEDLKIPLHIVATNLNKGESVYFNKGDLSRVIMASSTIPVLFSPIKIGESLYVDGGVLNNLPIEPLEDICDFIIGVHLNPTIIEEEIFTLQSIAIRCFHLGIVGNSKSKEKKCNLLIEPLEISKFRLLDFSKGKEMFSIGYDAAKKAWIDYQEKQKR